MISCERPLLVLDLDETLVHAVEGAPPRPADFHVGPYSILVRPGAPDFLRRLARGYDLAVWSTSTEPYAEEVVDALVPPELPLAFVWARGRCAMRPRGRRIELVKDLGAVREEGWPLSRVLVVDDTPSKLDEYRENLVRIEPFLGDANDRALEGLAPRLMELLGLADLRGAWRASLEGRRT